MPTPWLARVTALLRDGAGVGRWKVPDEGREVPTSHFQLCLSPVFLGREASHELGSVYQIWHLLRPVLVLARHDAVAQFYRNHLEHVRTKHMSLGCVFEHIVGFAIGTCTGKEWTRHKVHFKTEFGKPTVHARQPLVEAQVCEWASRLSVVAAGLDGFSAADLDLNGLTLKVLSDICYGPGFAKAHATELEDIVALHSRLMAHLGTPRTCMAGYRYLPTPLNRDMRRFEARWRSFNRRAWSEIPAGDACVVGHLRHLGSAGALHLSEREIHHNLEEILLLNVDVIYGAMGALMVDLARRPDWQVRLRQEIAKVAGSAKTLAAADLEGLQDMGNFITESARVWPALALTLPEELPCDMEIHGARVPAGTLAVIDTFSVNHDPAVFADPDRFDPDRFRGNAALRHKMFRFGMGPRKCMGQHYATAIIKALLVHVLSERHLAVADPADGEPAPRSARNSRGEELSYAAPCRSVRDAGMAYFSPYLVFPRLRAAPLWRSPLHAPAIDAVDVVARFWRAADAAPGAGKDVASGFCAAPVSHAGA